MQSTWPKKNKTLIVSSLLHLLLVELSLDAIFTGAAAHRSSIPSKGQARHLGGGFYYQRLVTMIRMSLLPCW